MTDPSPRHVLVTGGGGYIGVVLVARLLELGYQVTVLDRLYWGLAPLADLLDRIRLIRDDVRTFDPALLDGVDAVVHLAGLSNDPTAEYNPEANWQMNALATERLGRLCKERGVRTLSFGSSCSVYDGLPPGNVHAEDAALQPRGAYALSKRYAEDALLALADRDFAPIILRQGTVYGFSPRMRYDLVVNTFVKDALSRGRLLLHGGGWMWRPLVDVRDVAEAHLACLSADPALVGGQVFNLLHQNYQIRQLAMLVAGSVQLLKRPVELDLVPAPLLVRDYRCANDKLRQTIGFEPRHGVLESIDHLLGQIAEDSHLNFGHPRHYNIEWMTLLCEIADNQRPFPSVF